MNPYRKFYGLKLISELRQSIAHTSMNQNHLVIIQFSVSLIIAIIVDIVVTCNRGKCEIFETIPFILQIALVYSSFPICTERSQN